MNKSKFYNIHNVCFNLKKKNEKEERKETVLPTEASVKVADFAPSVTADDRPNSFK